jgi:uncharacterized membrane protein
MAIYCFAFLIGIASGMRSMLGLAAVAWSAHCRRLNLADTKLAFFGFAATPWILSAAALGELIFDKLPSAMSRTLPMPFITRLVTGSLCGAAIGLTAQRPIGGALAGALGAVVGTFRGAKFRGALAKALGRDLPAALLEDVVAIALAVFAVTR